MCLLIRFANQHHPLSWGCAFKGEGHQRLVSRRWLEFGPWHLLKGANDTSLVQFHDLEADCNTALSQAKIGHQRMGVSPTGGVIRSDFTCDHPIKGLYTLEERKLETDYHPIPQKPDWVRKLEDKE